MIVGDAEIDWKYINNCLGAAKDFVREIIIVAPPSSGAHAEKIAEQYGAKIIFREWRDDFSDARNESLRHATKPWILVLDADEMIFPNGFAKIREALGFEERFDSHDAFEMLQVTYSNNRLDADWRPIDNDFTRKTAFKGAKIVPMIRLFRNSEKIRFIHRAHEVVDEGPIAGRVGRLEIPIHHLKFYKGAAHFKRVEMRALGLLKKEVEERPDYAKAWMDLGLTALNVAKDYAEAVHCLSKARELAPDNAEIPLNIARAHSEAGELDKAAAVLKEILEKNPRAYAAIFNLATVLAKQRKFKESIETYEKAMAISQKDEKMIADRIAHLKGLMAKQ
jgi:tetratricopeptide (TPR) repeat protein